MMGRRAEVSVVIPTFRRPVELYRCLNALVQQSSKPEEIIVVRRIDDEQSSSVVAEIGDPSVIDLTVRSGGMVKPMAAGALRSTQEIIAFTDDDAVARPNWIARMEELFADPAVGAVGGRDVSPLPPIEPGLTEDVGRITAWGKVIGNHHRGGGGVREVAILKGVNMAFRREALALPEQVRGAGTQTHIEIATCLWARQEGWKMLYDPDLVVDHYPGPRFGHADRARPRASFVADTSYNLVSFLLSVHPELFWRRAAFGLLVGDRRDPGIARGAIGALRGEWEIVRKVLPSLYGQLHALFDTARGRRVRMRIIGQHGSYSTVVKDRRCDRCKQEPLP